MGGSGEGEREKMRMMVYVPADAALSSLSIQTDSQQFRHKEPLQTIDCFYVGVKIKMKLVRINICTVSLIQNNFTYSKK